MVTVSNIQLVQSRFSRIRVKISRFYLNVRLPLVRSRGVPYAYLFRFLVIAMFAVLLTSVITFADICSGLCADPIFDKAAANNAFVGDGGFLRFPPRTLLMSTMADGPGVWTTVDVPLYQRS